MTKWKRARTDPEQRFWRYVNKTETCWLWTGGNNGCYGVFYAGPDCVPMRPYAHRWSYTHFVGEIPENMHINHLCETKMCIRPDHLEVTTPQQNMTYGNHPAAEKSRQTHCKRGHEFNVKNTYYKFNGTRTCRECHRLNQHEYYHTKRARESSS